MEIPERYPSRCEISHSYIQYITPFYKCLSYTNKLSQIMYFLFEIIYSFTIDVVSYLYTHTLLYS